MAAGFGGVSHLDDGTWTSYTTTDGLLNDTVYDIGFDLDGSVWFATGAGACRLKDGSFQEFITAVPERMASAMELQLFYNSAMESIHLTYTLTRSAPVTARLFNMSGMLVGEWPDLPSMAGEHRVEIPLAGQTWGGPLDGIYVVQLIHGTRSDAQKLIITH